jgi:hypothetical protein
MGALDAAYHALTRVRPAFRVPAMPGNGCETAPCCRVAALTRAAAAQSNVTNVAFVITGALFGERVRASAAPAVAPVPCVPASRRAARAAHRAAPACSRGVRRPQLVSGAFDSAWKSNNRGVRPCNAAPRPTPRTHHGPHTPLRLACACRRVAHASPPVPGRSSRAGGPARNGCALQRLSFRVAPQNTLSLPSDVTSASFLSAEAVRRHGGGRHRQGLSAPRWPKPLRARVRWNPTHARSFRVRPAVAAS